MYIYTLQDALLIGYKHSLDNARSIAFSQRASSTHLIEDEIFIDNDIINNLVDFEHEELDSLRADAIFAGIQLSNNSEKHFLKIDTNSEKSLKFQKELRRCISGYREVHKQLTNQPSSQKFITYFLVPKNKLIEFESPSDESDIELIHHKKMSLWITMSSSELCLSILCVCENFSMYTVINELLRLLVFGGQNKDQP
ncbi:uncharacterized protein TNCV_5094611 [Trichonephila clavipes]|nr:uncharacterized protein TNCV_5094611 [Trichonephila clavipes]